MKRLNNNSTDVAGSVSLVEWRGFVKEYEWLSSSTPSANVSTAAENAAAENGGSKREPSKEPNEISSQLQRVTETFTEEERLLFDLLIVTSWNFPTGKKSDNEQTDGGTNADELCPLYRLQGGKLKVSSLPTSTDARKMRSRIDILEERFRRSRKFFHSAVNGSNSNNSDGSSEEQCAQWWKHALSMATSMADFKNVEVDDKKPAAKQHTASSFVNSLTAQSNGTAELNNGTANDDSNGKKLTLEERIRARAAAQELIQKRNNPNKLQLQETKR
jgi:hypothetical protein